MKSLFLPAPESCRLIRILSASSLAGSKEIKALTSRLTPYDNGAPPTAHHVNETEIRLIQLSLAEMETSSDLEAKQSLTQDPITCRLLERLATVMDTGLSQGLGA